MDHFQRHKCTENLDHSALMSLTVARRTKKLQSGAPRDGTRTTGKTLRTWRTVPNKFDVVARGYLVAVASSPSSIRSAMRLSLAYVKLVPVDCVLHRVPCRRVVRHSR